MSKTDDKKKKGVAIIIAVGGKPPNSPTKTLDPDEKKKMADAWDFLKKQFRGQPRKTLNETNAKANAEERVQFPQSELQDSEDPLPVVGQSGYDMRATEDRPIEETLDPAIQHGLAQREISGPLMSARPKQRELDFSDPPNPFQKAWAFLKNEPTHCPIHGDELQMIGDPGADEFGPSWCPTCAELPRNEMGEQVASVLGER